MALGDYPREFIVWELLKYCDTHPLNNLLVDSRELCNSFTPKIKPLDFLAARKWAETHRLIKEDQPFSIALDRNGHDAIRAGSLQAWIEKQEPAPSLSMSIGVNKGNALQSLDAKNSRQSMTNALITKDSRHSTIASFLLKHTWDLLIAIIAAIVGGIVTYLLTGCPN